MSLALEKCPACRSTPDHAANADTPDFEAFPELSRREIMLLFLACDVCLAGAENLFQGHTETAIDEAGMSLEDIRELLRHIAPYAGFNAIGMAFERLLETAGPTGAEESATPELPGESEAAAYSPWALEGFQSLDPIFAEQLRLSTDHLWSRPGLTPRERALATLAVDVAGATLGCSFAAHVALAHQHGVNSSQVSAMLRLLGQRMPARAEQASEALSIAAAA